jgi:hypothetical protein
MEGLAIEDVGTIYGPLVYFTSIWYILWSFGIFYGYLEYFSRFGKLYQEKSGNPDRWDEGYYGFEMEIEIGFGFEFLKGREELVF